MSWTLEPKVEEEEVAEWVLFGEQRWEGGRLAYEEITRWRGHDSFREILMDAVSKFRDRYGMRPVITVDEESDIWTLQDPYDF